MLSDMTTQTTMTPIQLGAVGEALAVDYLTRMGLHILQRNWRCRYGELDVIASDDAARAVVFVEVKTRTGDGYGGVGPGGTPPQVGRVGAGGNPPQGATVAQAGGALAGRPG